MADFWSSTARNLQRSNVARSALVNFWPEPEYPTLTPTRTFIHHLLNQSPIINIDHARAQMSNTSIVVSHHLIRLSGDTVLRVGTQDTRAMSRDELQIILQVMRAATFVCPRKPPITTHPNHKSSLDMPQPQRFDLTHAIWQTAPRPVVVTFARAATASSAR